MGVHHLPGWGKTAITKVAFCTRKSQVTGTEKMSSTTNKFSSKCKQLTGFEQITFVTISSMGFQLNNMKPVTCKQNHFPSHKITLA
jgi:hypothetical protein